MRAQHARRKTSVFNPPGVLATWIHLPWALVHIGVGVMIGLLIAASTLTGSTPAPPPAALSLPPGTQPVRDPTPIVERRPVVPLAPGAATRSPSPSAEPPAPASDARPARGDDDGDDDGGGGSAKLPVSAIGPSASLRKKPTGDPDLIGTFRVLQSFSDTFIGEVLVKNTTGKARNWTVVLRFPDNVGGLRTAWVEGAPQARQRRSGDTLTFTSTAPVAARSSVPLRFQFDSSGSERRPKVCTVNAASCRR